MQVAVVTFDGFNELDSFIASGIINRCRRSGLEAWTTVIMKTLGEDAVRGAFEYVAPVGEQQETVEHVMRAVRAGEVALR